MVLATAIRSAFLRCFSAALVGLAVKCPNLNPKPPPPTNTKEKKTDNQTRVEQKPILTQSLRANWKRQSGRAPKSCYVPGLGETKV